MSRDYKSTVFLPQTDFPMKARLAEREPAVLAQWQQQDLEGRRRALAAGREKFILHDGPPYANGHLHIGHAFNKILKDLINRSRYMDGAAVNYVPGWDCHGLPIEWKIEEKYRQAGRDKDEVPVIEFRAECRAFAEQWIGIQRKEFVRLGVGGDWERPYTTMSFNAEAQIVRELGKFLLNGGLYRGEKPVMWSVVEKTALAEAEIEYHDVESAEIFVRFPVLTSPVKELSGGGVVIWTTTPWTIPGNRAIAYGAEIDYLVVAAKSAGPVIASDDVLVVAETLASEVMQRLGVGAWETRATLKGAALSGTVCRHPLAGQGYDFEVPLLPGAHVTTEQGTGFVHTAPTHGPEDFEVGCQFGLEVPRTVEEDGIFHDKVPLFAGQHVFKVEKPVLEALTAANALLASGRLVHSYPHSWRSKAPLIYRTTPQWFISMEENGLREKALAAIDATRFAPERGRNRIRTMVETRPDWCVSRQRAWGVPLTVFIHRETGAPLRDPAVMERIVEAVAAEGADVWFTADAARFLGGDHDPRDYDQVHDILDVWFDSGATHSFVLEPRKDDDMSWPADLYLEGSDQHRGWFQSSLLEACGTRGKAPFKAVLTHGFVLDQKGRKMSKSLGNVVAPQDVVGEHGADVLRLWVALSDYAEDLRLGPEILRQHADYYRRLRNTLRYVLGNLSGFSEEERLAPEDMPELDRWVLHRLYEMDQLLRRSIEAYDFHGFYSALHTFCAVELSAFYFDVRKDALYCDYPGWPRRRAVRTVLAEIFSCLTAWLAPVLCFTAEEAWRCHMGEEADSVHLRLFPELPEAWRDDALAAKWDKIRALRRVVTGALEKEREAKRIGSSLQARPMVYAAADYVTAMEGVDAAEIFITSDATVIAGPPPDGLFVLADVPDVGVDPGLAEGEKCVRCWKVLLEVGTHPGHEALCHRCAEAVSEIDAHEGAPSRVSFGGAE